VGFLLCFGGPNYLKNIRDIGWSIWVIAMEKSSDDAKNNNWGLGIG
jgi:hypothetical protein